jgi:hypothetical protein
MATFGTLTKTFTPLFLPAIKSTGSWINGLNDSAQIGSARAGAISARITTAVTMQTPADGTMLANNAARTEVALTAFKGVHTVSLWQYETDQYDASADAKEFSVFLDASRLLAEKTVITDLVAGTPNNTQTLVAGQLNLSTDGTDAEIRSNLSKLDIAIGNLMAQVAGKSDGVFAVTTPLAWANLHGLIAQSNYGAFLSQSATDSTAGVIRYRGIPIYMYNGAAVSGFGESAGDEILYFVHRDAYALTWADAWSPNGGNFTHEPDGFMKKYFHCFGFAGRIQNTHYTCVKNGTS